MFVDHCKRSKRPRSYETGVHIRDSECEVDFGTMSRSISPIKLLTSRFGRCGLATQNWGREKKQKERKGSVVLFGTLSRNLRISVKHHILVVHKKKKSLFIAALQTLCCNCCWPFAVFEAYSFQCVLIECLHIAAAAKK